MTLSEKLLIQMALEEDIGTQDITTDLLIDPDQRGMGIIFAKEAVVVAGIHVAKEVFFCLDADVKVQFRCSDGDTVEAGRSILEAEGRVRSLLTGERTVLNFLQRLSGIATWVRSHVGMIKETPVRLVDTRKTTPGWRALEKYAVRMGGAHNHRMGLYDGILIKDNHIQSCGSVREAIARIREKAPHLLKIEVEASDLDQVKEALEAGAEVIMLDNMDIQTIREAVFLIDQRAVIEVSGRVAKEDLRMLADAGVDIISMGALTHSARSVDLSMDIHPAASRPAGR